MASISSLRKIWPQMPDIGAGAGPPEYLRLLEYLSRSCNDADLQNGGFATNGLADTLDMVPRMRLLATLNCPLGQMTRKDILDGLKQNPDPSWRSNKDPDILKSLCLAMSLWLTLDIKTPGAAGIQSIEWDENTTVAALIDGAFPSGAPAPGTQQARPIDPRLTLEYLESYHGFRLLFTDNLARHLDLQVGPNSRPLLLVYRHKVYLRNECRYGDDAASSRGPLPRDLVEEGLDTLNLLLPYDDARRTQRFLERCGMADVYGLAWCGRPPVRNLDLARYRYFGDKLASLSALVAQGPIGLRQLKPGRGPGANVREFFNFWIAVVVLAVLTVGFGTASVVLGALQYNVGKQQYDIAVMQYQLSLAQACAAMNSSQLPGWC